MSAAHLETCPRCGQTLPAGRLTLCPHCLVTGEPPPVIIGNGTLELGDELGAGGMGTVFRARHLRLGRQVAVKFLPGEMAEKPEFRTRFQREAHALALLNHPNIVTIHDYGEEDGQAYIVMELVEGSSLQELLPLAPERAIDVVLSVAGALSYAHEQGVIHRDIKPGNVLLDSAGNVKVSDFGLARMASESARGWTLTTPDQALGTLYYMAPEVLQGAPPTPQVDIYATGVLLYQLLMGTPPLGDYERLPGALDGVVRRALAQRPEKRHHSIDEFASELNRARHHVTASSGELPLAERQWLRAVALVHATATAIAGWALLVSLTPRGVHSEDVHPLSLVSPRNLGDGQVVSLARFEVWPTLGALAAFGLALTASGFLGRHFSRVGLDKPDPERPLAESKQLFRMGLVACAVYVSGKLTQRWGNTLVSMYLPFFGALIELLAMYVLWVGLLEARRRSRPLSREWRLFVGFGLMLLPPAVELILYSLPWLSG